MLNIMCLQDFDYQNIMNEKGATIYFSIEGEAFPDIEWFDLPISILDMWCHVMSENYKKSQSNFKLHFMDGPYYVSCNKNGKTIEMKFIEEKEQEEILFKYNLGVDDLVKMLINVAQDTISSIEEHTSPKLKYLNELKNSVTRLQKAAHL